MLLSATVGADTVQLYSGKNVCRNNVSVNTNRA